MIEIIKQCEYLYNALTIPIYVYDNSKNLITCFPVQKDYIHPPLKYISQLSSMDSDITYLESASHTYYGYIAEQNKGVQIVVGPIHPLPYTNAVLSMMHDDYDLPKSYFQDFDNFFYAIPPKSLESFVNLLLLINFTVNHTQLTASEVKPYIDSTPHRCIKPKYLEESIASLDEYFFRYNYEKEEEFLNAVESGNISRLNMFFEKSDYQNCTSKTSTYSLRQTKNNLLIGISLIARSATKGGLAPLVSYQLTDVYLRQIEQATDVNFLGSLFVQASLDFTNRTASSKIPENVNKDIADIIKYINENIYKNITVNDVADYMNFNRSYLSRKFKSELGIDLSSYIKNAKLEESKNLLKHSNMSISEISNLLCFSSQSHFQNAFKKQYEMTPQTFRKSNPS